MLHTSIQSTWTLRRRRGFTLLELLIVTVIIAILASIAIAKFSESKRRAYVSAMKADLRNLATTAESQFATNNSYVGLVAPQGSAGVTMTLISVTPSEWSASAVHAAAANITCTISLTGAPGPQRPQPDCR